MKPQTIHPLPERIERAFIFTTYDHNLCSDAAADALYIWRNQIRADARATTAPDWPARLRELSAICAAHRLDDYASPDILPPVNPTATK